MTICGTRTVCGKKQRVNNMKTYATNDETLDAFSTGVTLVLLRKVMLQVMTHSVQACCVV
jgi:hypothetical protein